MWRMMIDSLRFFDAIHTEKRAELGYIRIHYKNYNKKIKKKGNSLVCKGICDRLGSI